MTNSKQRKVTFYPVLPPNPKKPRANGARAYSVTEPCKLYLRHKATKKLRAGGSAPVIWLDDASAQQLGNSSRTVVSHPDWRANIAKGLGASYSYARQIIQYKPISYGCHTEDSTWESDGYGTVGGTGPINAATADDVLTDIATARLKNRLSGNIGEAQLAAPLAESREIGRLVRQINNVGVDTLMALLTLRKTKGKSAAKLAGNIWLGFAFGINPMLKDIETAASSILKFTMRRDRRLRVTGTATKEWTSATKTGPENVSYGGDLYTTCHYHHRQGVQLVAGLNLLIGTGSSYSVTDHLGLQVSALPAVAWELTPYSWVVDYFTTVGPWLDDVFTSSPVSTIYVTKASKYLSVGTEYPELRPQTGFRMSGGASQGKSKYMTFSRTVLSSLPSRALRVKSVDEIAKNSLNKLLNLSSVLAGRASK